MKECLKCKSQNLTESKVSEIISGTYLYCSNCGNVMINKNNAIIPTPEENGDVTALLIADAKKSLFGDNAAPITAISEEDATQIKLQDYLNKMLIVNNDEEYDEELEEDIEELEELLYDDEDFEYETQRDAKNYLIVNDDAKTIFCYDYTKEEMQEFLKNLNEKVQLFEIKEVPLTQEVVYTF